MGFFQFIVNQLKNFSIPVFKSFTKAYKDTTSGGNKGSQNSGKKHPIDDFFKSMMSKTNLSAPPLDTSTALKILNIQATNQKLDSKVVLDRYYTLYKKNNPKNGGTVYLQSKVFAAKQCLMSEFPNAAELQQQFYTSVVEPEQKAEEQAKKQEEEKAKKAAEAKRQQSLKEQSKSENKKQSQ